LSGFKSVGLSLFLFAKNMRRIFRRKAFKGYFLAALAAISVSNVFIFSKAALNETPYYTFGFYWFLCAFSYNLAMIIFSGKIKLFLQYSPQTLRAIAIIGTFEMLAAITFFNGIKQVENPAIASFLVNTTPVFVTLMSIPLLNEKFNRIEALGILITMAGAFMLSYSGHISFSHLFVKGANMVILSCIISAIGLVVAKKNIKNVDPYILSFSRTVFLLLFYLIAIFVIGGSFVVSGKAMMNMALGSFFGPFIASMLQYNAFKYIEVSKESLIQNTNGMFVLLTAWLYLSIMPQPIQFIGGAVMIGGVSLLVWGKMYGNKQKIKRRRQTTKSTT
jgi:drug/metabolite transporter (DMT)-like permease